MSGVRRGVQRLVLVLLVLGAAGAHAEVRKEIRPGVTSLTDKSPKGTAVHASVTVGQLDAKCRGGRGYWGVDGGAPAVGVTGLTITVGMDTVDVPFTAWADLGDPKLLRLTVGGQGATLILEGGETSTHYMASWVVLNRVLYKRRVELSEFSSEIWSETVYSINRLDTDDF